MQKNWQVGALFGIPLFIDRSWFLILILITSLDANDATVRSLVNTEVLAWLTGFGMALLLFLSVLLHELGHSLVAQSQGIEVKSITLFLFGGIASIERESQNPLDAFAVAIAGPLVSLSLFAVGWVVSFNTPEISLVHFFAKDISQINLVLALFNLIPGLPLDGGQMFKAIVWKWTGDRFRGIRYAAASGKFLGTSAVVLGLVAILLAGELGGLWVALVGWFILRNANAYERLTDLQNVLMSLTAENVMSRDFRVVDAHLSLREFADQYVLDQQTKMKVIFASSEGRYRGLIRPTALQSIERSLWETMELIDIALPLSEIPSVAQDVHVADIICKLEELEENFITVLSPAGAVAGIVDRGNIVQAIAKEYTIEIPAAELTRIRTDRVYPSGFPLVDIAKQLKSETGEAR
ncbi:MAG: site-2 protease family protein [Limnothrix sp. RL_2_0]|nr:site-2 protease family protein [Limnothrix sp. RL_2_0]